MCQYRAVGHPIATAVTEGLVELAAAKIGMDPLEIRRRNLIADDAHPSQGPSGIKFEALSNHEALAHLDSMMNYAGLRAEQEQLRKQGIYRGIGFASFVEVTNPSRGVLRRRRRAHLGAGRRHGAARRAPARSSATPASPSRARAPKP